MRELSFRYVWKRPKSGAGSYCIGDPKFKMTYASIKDLENGKFPETPPYTWENDHHLGQFSILVAREQYIGFKDENGKKIYEGDILSPIENLSQEGCQVVQWDNDIAGFVTSGGLQIKDECSEVIGNIHENPELLKEQDGRSNLL